VAVELAAARPELVKRLVLAGVPAAERLPTARQPRLVVDLAAYGNDPFEAAAQSLASTSARSYAVPLSASVLRLNKFISETGVCSRREADKWIEAGRVTCNGQPAALGTRVQDGDEVRVDGELIGAKKKPIYIALNKPVGITCTTETDIEDNIIDLVGHPDRIFPIGRLDKDSEGLILLTNNGDIVNEILRSENNHEKEYIVTVDRPITDLSLQMMASGVKIMGELTKPCKVSRIDQESFRMILTQGLNRQIRRMCSALGYKARRLQRVRIMNIHLGTWRSGAMAPSDRYGTCRSAAGLNRLMLVGPQRRRRDAFRPKPAAE
jgi:23S rRNA pseudouridine2604 synthase